MGMDAWIAISLSVYADTLDPVDLSQALKCPFDRGHRMGDRIGRGMVGQKYGHWSISEYAHDHDDINAEEALDRIIKRVPVSVAAWSKAVGKAEARLLVTFELTDVSLGFSMNAKHMSWLSARKIRLDVNVYDKS